MVDIIQPLDYLGRLGGNTAALTGNAMPQMLAQQAANAEIAGQRQQVAMQQAAMGELQQRQQRAAAYQQALQQHLLAPSPSSTAALVMQFPEYAKEIKDAYALEDEAKRNADLEVKSAVYSRAHAGDWKAAAAELTRYIDAARAAGQDVSDEEQMLAHINSGDPTQQNMVTGILGYDLATAVGPEKWAAFHGGKVVNGALVDNTGKPLYEAPEKGNYQLVPVLDEYGVDTGLRRSVNTAVGDVATTDAIINAESGGNPNAANPNSTASGLGQFLDGTWIEQFRKVYPGATISDAQILAQKTNPTVARRVTQAYAAENQRYLASKGLPVTPGATYLAHFAGPAGAEALLTAPPSTPVDRLLSPDAIAANPEVLGGKTAGEVVAWAGRKVGASAGPSQVQLAKRFGDAGSGYRWRPDGTREPIPTAGGGGSKPLPAATVDKLAGEAETVQQLADLRGAFKNEYAGFGSRIGNFAGRLGLGTAEQGAQADFWQRMEAFDNVVRNQLFGASLTEGEKAAWERTTVTPNMSPERIRANLLARDKILTRSLQRRLKSYAAAGYNVEGVADVMPIVETAGQGVAKPAGGWTVTEVKR